MTINKIKKRYCANDKVQVMFSNAPSQIIFSKDGYIYLREQDVTVHRYLTDPVRKEMPYRNNPSSTNHATHLFEYDKIYAKFTRYRNIGRGYHPEDSYSLTFLYFVRAENGKALCAEISVDDFKKEEETSQKLSKAELEKFLYALNGTQAKCIFEWFRGIQYVKHAKEVVGIANDNFLNLSDEEIIKRYNFKMYVYDFTVKFINKDCFEAKSVKRKIALSYNDILRYANNCEYPSDPSFDDE